jgi:hypothetical protein
LAQARDANLDELKASLGSARDASVSEEYRGAESHAAMVTAETRASQIAVDQHQTTSIASSRIVKIAFAGIMTVVAAGSSVVIGIVQVVAGCIIVQQQVIAIVLVKIAFADMMRVMLLRVIAFAGMM